MDKRNSGSNCLYTQKDASYAVRRKRSPTELELRGVKMQELRRQSRQQQLRGHWMGNKIRNFNIIEEP